MLEKTAPRKTPFHQLKSAADTIEVATALGTAALGFSSVFAIATAFLAGNATVLRALIIAVLPMSATMAGGWVYLTRHYTPKPYEIIELLGIMEIHQVQYYHRYVYTRRQRVRASRNDIRLVEFREYWTGKGPKGSTQVRSMRSNHTLLDGGVPEEDGRVRRWIYLREPLMRGQEADVCLQQTHEDSIEAQLPFFRQGTADFRARRMTVEVRFPSGHEPVKVTGVTWNTYRPLRYHTIETFECPRTANDDGTVSYHVSIDRPKRYHSYGMRWAWSDHREEARETGRPLRSVRAGASGDLDREAK